MSEFDQGLYAAWAASEATLHDAMRRVGPGAPLNALDQLAELKLEANQRFLDFWTASAAPPVAAGLQH